MSDGVRVDQWLWAARFFKTRSLAKAAIDGGKIRLNAQPTKPGKTVRAGDRLEVGRGEEIVELEVLALSEVRGPASVAQTLYSETALSQARRIAARESRRLTQAGYARPPAKPDKRARRELLKFLAPE